jgi:hypothetical protein
MASVAHEYLATDPISNDAHSLFIFNLLLYSADMTSNSSVCGRCGISKYCLKIYLVTMRLHGTVYTDTVVNVVETGVSFTNHLWVTDYHSNGLGVKVQSCPTVRTSTDLSEVDCGGARFHRHIVASR